MVWFYFSILSILFSAANRFLILSPVGQLLGGVPAFPRTGNNSMQEIGSSAEPLVVVFQRAPPCILMVICKHFVEEFSNFIQFYKENTKIYDFSYGQLRFCGFRRIFPASNYFRIFEGNAAWQIADFGGMVRGHSLGNSHYYDGMFWCVPNFGTNFHGFGDCSRK